jgi:hypothetical protein
LVVEAGGRLFGGIDGGGVARRWRGRLFSRMAMNSISGVMMPWRAYQSCVTGWPADARSGRRLRAEVSSGVRRSAVLAILRGRA